MTVSRQNGLFPSSLEAAGLTAYKVADHGLHETAQSARVSDQAKDTATASTSPSPDGATGVIHKPEVTISLDPGAFAEEAGVRVQWIFPKIIVDTKAQAAASAAVSGECAPRSTYIGTPESFPPIPAGSYVMIAPEMAQPDHHQLLFSKAGQTPNPRSLALAHKYEFYLVEDGIKLNFQFQQCINGAWVAETLFGHEQRSVNGYTTFEALTGARGHEAIVLMGFVPLKNITTTQEQRDGLKRVLATSGGPVTVTYVYKMDGKNCPGTFGNALTGSSATMTGTVTLTNAADRQSFPVRHLSLTMRFVGPGSAPAVSGRVDDSDRIEVVARGSGSDVCRDADFVRDLETYSGFKAHDERRVSPR